MENPQVLKTALSVGVLGTAAVALGYYYLNDENTKEDVPPTEFKENQTNEPESITTDVIKEIAEKKSQMKSFWEETYKTFIEPSSVNENTDN